MSNANQTQSPDMTFAAPPHARAVDADFSSEDFCVAAGVAIFHLASQRVVVCNEMHRGRKYYFLPKGRRDIGEESGRNAIREGFEESGFRNRLLPLPTKHKQPAPVPRPEKLPLTAEAVSMQLMRLHSDRQYILFWYIAETLPPAEQEALDQEYGPKLFGVPTEYPQDLSLRARIGMEPEGYEPKRTEGTGVDATEALYESALYPLSEALTLLGDGSAMADVVRRGWKAVVKRWNAEEGVAEAEVARRASTS